MYLWQIFLSTLLGLLPIGIFCRWYVDMLFDLGHLSWVKYSGKKLSLLKRRSPFLWLLMATEGLLSNFALFGLIISIPLYFFLGI